MPEGDGGGGESLLDGEDERLTPLDQRDSLRHAQEPDPSDGSFSYIFPLRVPSGRNGIQPSLALRYNSGSGKNQDLFGYGWSVSIPYIQLQNKRGTDAFYSAGSSTPFFYSSEDGELATTSDGSTTSYGPKVEGGEFRSYTYSTTTGWTVTDKDGRVFRYGTTTAARQDRPGDSSKIYKWLLEEVRDPNGNYMYYEYYKHLGEIYPSKIGYTHNATSTGLFEVEFLREARGESASSSLTGFNVTTSYRVNEIQLKIGGAWAAKYALSYSAGDDGERSLLSSITETGKDESGNTLSLPPTSFDYQQLQASQRSWTVDADWDAPSAFTAGSNDRGVRLGDVNGDGLADVVRSDNLGGADPEGIWINMGAGEGWEEDAGMTIPYGMSIGDGSRDTGTRLLDVNGDGLIDMLRTGWGTSTVQINKGDGTGWVASTSWVIPVAFTNSNGTTDYGVRFGDVNGDGLVDMVQALSGSTTARKVFVNNANGTGWTHQSTYEVSSNYDFTDGTNDGNNRLEDVNADGLADIVHGGGAVYINKGDGTGWARDWSWPTVPEVFASPGDTGARLSDINGDQFTDIIRRADYNTGTVTARYINHQRSWESTSDWPVAAPFLSSTYPDEGTRIADVDGDGLPDLVRCFFAGACDTYLNDAKPVDLLIQVTESSGGRTAIAYEATTEQSRYVSSTETAYNHPYLPLTLQTVKTITRDDAFGTIATTTYDYWGGDYYFKNPIEKKFAGFEIIARTDPVGNVTKTFYHQGNNSSSTKGEYDDHISKAGKPFRIEQYDSSGNLFSKTISKWDMVTLGGNDRRYVKLHQSLDFSYDGDSDHRELATTYTYNATGSIIGTVNWGEVSGNDDGTFSDTGTDLASTSISYVASSTGTLLLPSQETTRDSTGGKVRETAFYYDSSSATSSAVSKGNVTKVAQWTSGTSYASNSRAYTPFGLVSAESDPRGGTTTYRADQYQLYIATSTNPLGQATNVYYDYSLGKPATTTDPNGRNSVTVYDALDRVSQVKEPDQHSPSTLAVKAAYTYTDSGSRNVKETQHLSSATSTDTYRYFDGFDRVIQERREAEDANAFAVRDFDYDKRGLLEKESIPYFSTGSATTTATSSVSAFINYYYDALGRVASTSDIFGATTYSHDDWRATTTDPLSHVKGIEKDAFGNLVRVNEVNATSTYATLYEYDRAGNLTKITDALGNIRNFTYDGLGRRLTAEDLHAQADGTYGTWTFTYDDAGNLATQLDPTSQTVTFAYDALNRILSEDYTGQTGTEIVYIYDTCSEGVGRLCAASTTAATTTFSYYANGLKKTETQQIGTTTATTTFAYDRQGNIATLTYPDGAQTEYRYNSAGLVDAVDHKEGGAATTTLVQDIDYGPHGKPTYQDFFNGTVTMLTHDMNAMWRLTNKTTVYDEETLGMSLMAPLFRFLRLNLSTIPFFSYARAEEVPEEAMSYPSEDQLMIEGATEVDDQSGEVVEAVPNTISDTDEGSDQGLGDDATSTAGTLQIDSGLSGDAATIITSETDATEDQHEPNTEELIGETLVDPESGAAPTSPAGSERADLLSWNVFSAREVSPGRVISDFRLKQVRFLNEADQFELISTELEPTPEGWCAARAPFRSCFPLRSIGATTFYNNNRFDNQLKKKIAGPTIAHEITPLGVEDIAGVKIRKDFGFGESEAILYRNAYSTIGADLAYLVHQGSVPRLRKIIQFNDRSLLPASDFELQFDTAYSAPVEFFEGGSDGKELDGSNTIESKEGITAKLRDAERAVVHEPFYIWDSSQAVKRERILVRLEPRDGNRYTLVKVIPRAFFDEAVFPVYTDTTDTFYSSTDDGNIDRAGTNLTWSDIRDGSGTESSIAQASVTFAQVLAGTTANRWNRISRGALYFDTSSLPDDTVISSATTSFRGAGKGNSFGGSVDLVDAPASIANGNYGGFGTALLATSIGLSSWAEDGWNSFTLNANGISQITATGTTDFGARSSYDTGNSAPTWSSGGNDYAYARFANYAGTSQDPTLVVDHAVPPPPPPPPSPPSGPNRQNFTYSYDAVGNVTQIVDSSDSYTWKTSDFGYDDLYRLTAASTSNATTSTSDYRHTYGYNAIGNLATNTTQGTYSYGSTNYANPHAATTIGTSTLTTLAYDNNGNLASTTRGSTITRYGWDYGNRLTQVATGTATTTFGYDYAGARVGLRTPGAGTTTYANQYFNKQNGTTTKHIFVGGQLVATIAGNGVSTSSYIVHTDHLGGTHVVTNASGTIVQTVDLYPFGDTRLSTGSYTDQRRFTGHEFDTSTDLSYMRARYYTGSRSQLLSQDPAFLAVGGPTLNSVTGRDLGGYLSDPQNLNSYSYARDNPLAYRDPSGKFGVLALMGIGALVGVTSQAIQDYSSGETIRWQNYAGAAAGGAVGSLALVGSIAVGLPLAPNVAGGVGGSVQETVSQSLGILTGDGEQHDWSKVLTRSGQGFVGALLPVPRMAGVTVGQGFSAVGKGITTKLAGNTINNFSIQTASKMLTSQFISSSAQAVQVGAATNQSIQQTALQLIARELSALGIAASAVARTVSNLQALQVR